MNQCLFPGEDKIIDVIKDMEPWSAAGPDGYPAGFYKRYWHIIGDDVVAAVHDFFHGTSLPRFFQAATVEIIPKVPHPERWGGQRLKRVSVFYVTRAGRTNSFVTGS